MKKGFIMRFIQITDTHIGQTPDFGNYGHRSLANLEKLVEIINDLTFQPDFVLHTGDVVEDWSEAAYKLAKPVLEKIKFPIYYVAGNHDDATLLQRVLLGREPSSDRFDYTFECDGIQFVVLDTRGGKDGPAGHLTPEQLSWLGRFCAPDGPPMVIIMHHQPVRFDIKWIDGWMTLDCDAEFRQTIAPARNRIRGVFFGHVHRAFQVINDGIMYCSA